jgi:hypothetical protein
MTKCSRLFFICVAWLVDSGAALRAQDGEIAILERADTALTELMAMPLNWVPAHRFMMAQLRKAQGVEQNYVQNSGPMGTRAPSPSLRLQMKLAELWVSPPAPHVIAPFR